MAAAEAGARPAASPDELVPKGEAEKPEEEELEEEDDDEVRGEAGVRAIAGDRGGGSPGASPDPSPAPRSSPRSWTRPCRSDSGA